MERPSIFDFAGGAPAFRALAAAVHERCLQDPILNHPFSHVDNPEHLERLADYLGEVFGGPATYSTSYGGHSAMLSIHAGHDAEVAMGPRFAACFRLALDDAGWPQDPQFRETLGSYIDAAAVEVMAYAPRGSVVPPDQPLPKWSWYGPVTNSDPS
ncbi:MAG TPA: oxidoreductase [Candidatus Dormibacteraeota bacterium]|jgi:hemoglobin|nr:oxidoreductase [Candidatus Dormibacteraeota bacterium]